MRALCGNDSYKLYEEINSTKWISWVEYGVYERDLVQVLIWIDIVLAVVGNALVVAWRCRLPKYKQCSPISIIVINLSVACLLYGVHLFLFQITATQCRKTGGLVEVNPCRAGQIIFALVAVMTTELTATTVILTFASLFNYLTTTNARRAFVVVIVVEWTIALAFAVYVAFNSTGYKVVSETVTTVDWRQCSPLHFFRKHTSYADVALFYVETAIVFVTFLVYLIIMIKVCILRVNLENGQIRFLSGFGARLFAITALVIVQWLSYAVARFREATGDDVYVYSDATERSIARVTIVSIVFRSAVATVNPLLYMPCGCFRRICRRRKWRRLGARSIRKNYASFSETHEVEAQRSRLWDSEDEDGVSFPM